MTFSPATSFMSFGKARKSTKDIVLAEYTQETLPAFTEASRKPQAMAQYLMALVDSHNSPIQVPSPLALAELFTCSEFKVLDAFSLLQQAGYGYQLSCLDRTVILKPKHMAPVGQEPDAGKKQSMTSQFLGSDKAAHYVQNAIHLG